MKPAVVGALLSVFLLGLYIGSRLEPSRTPAPVAAPATSAREDEARSLLEKSAVELKNAATDEERRRKTDELLEKIFKLFLIDVSLRIQNVADAKSPEPAVAAPVAARDHQPPPEPKQEAAAAKVDPKIAANRKRQIEITIVNAESPGDIKRALSELAKQDFDGGYKGSKPLSAEQIQAIQGLFAGRVDFYDRRESWRITLSLSSNESAPGHPLYKYKVRVTKQGGKESESSGDGNNVPSFSMGDGPDAPLYVEVGTSVLMLYQSKAFDGFSGLYYEDLGKHDYHPIGTIRLERRGN